MTEDIKAVIARVRDARASSWTGGRSVMLLADWRDNLLAHIADSPTGTAWAAPAPS